MDQVMVTTIKQGLDLGNEPVSVTLLDQQTIEKRQISTMKDVTAVAPNFYIPDYGSRITSSIYVRGLGARIDQPVVGLNIDNVPYINKNGFDTEVMGIERIEVLRGPQSTLYGRNTMGGVVNIYTISPFNYQGLKVGLSYGSTNAMKANATYYHKFSNRFAASLGGYYSSTDGYFTNETTGEKCDVEQSMGGRLRLQYLPSAKTRIDNTLAISHVDQGGYAYRNLATGVISYNDPSSYKRTLINNGLSVVHTEERWTLASITSYQYLDDHMTLDQDFTPYSYFTLQQAIQEHSFTEDLVARSRNVEGYNWIAGLFGQYSHKSMQGPVEFKQMGIDSLILSNATQSDNYYYEWDTDRFTLYSDFCNITYSAAAYHESSYTRGRWRATLGARVDYEKTTLQYHSYTNTGCTKYYDYDSANDEWATWYKAIAPDLKGAPSQSFLEILPKANVSYRLGAQRQSSLYATVAKGYKAGGYNTQMFSDILQQEIMSLFAVSALYSAEEIIAYKPEYSWNYEVGAHLLSRDRTLAADLSLFYISCQDQQLTVFPEGMVTGRMMTNAGESRSIGAEFSGRATFGDLNLNVAYGYTNAKFVIYDDNESDYSGNYIPYSPTQTISANIDYGFELNSRWADRVIVAANTSGAGRIYWNESNSLSQPLYMLLGSEVRIEGRGYNLTLWGRNLANKAYDTFYFMSCGNEFMQQGKPRSIGVTLNLDI